MSWGEAFRLTLVLARDPASAVAAAVAEWSHPMSWEALVLADLYDLQHQAKAKRRPPPYPRPWTDKERTTRRGTARLTKAELVAVLDATRNAPPEVIPHG